MNIISASLLILLPSASASLLVDLGSSSCFAILIKDGVDNTGVTQIYGNVGTTFDPLVAFTGFELYSLLDGTGEFSMSPMVNGALYGASHSVPTPAKFGRCGR